jgi:hypothetical protein
MPLCPCVCPCLCLRTCVSVSVCEMRAEIGSIRCVHAPPTSKEKLAATSATARVYAKASVRPKQKNHRERGCVCVCVCVCVCMCVYVRAPLFLALSLCVCVCVAVGHVGLVVALGQGLLDDGVVGWLVTLEVLEDIDDAKHIARALNVAGHAL